MFIQQAASFREAGTMFWIIEKLDCFPDKQIGAIAGHGRE